MIEDGRCHREAARVGIEVSGPLPLSQTLNWAMTPRRIGRYLLFDAFARGGMASVHFGRVSGAVGF